MTDLYIIFITVIAILILLFLVIHTKLHAFVALLLVSIFVGVISGMPLNDVILSVQVGMGSILGYVAVIVGLGAMFGQMLEASGGAQKLAHHLILRLGEDKAPIALGITGFLVAIPVFFDIGFIILVPLIYGLAKKTGRSLLYYGIPLLAGLAVTHSFMPPTPGPIAVAKLLGAEIGWVILFGLLAGIPSMLIAGPLFGKFISKKIHIDIPEYIDFNEVEHNDTNLPPISVIAIIILSPIFLIVLNTLSSLLLTKDTFYYNLFQFIGHPFIALLFATLLAFYFLGHRHGYSKKEVQIIANKALEPAGIIILVTGAGGVFKEVLIDSGAGTILANFLGNFSISPFLLGFIIAVIVRISQGSATIAMITSASIVSSLIHKVEYSPPELGLIVIAIASGATIFSHVNDSGFWLINRYFGMDIKETFLSWTIMETIIALVGFTMVLCMELLFI